MGLKGTGQRLRVVREPSVKQTEELPSAAGQQVEEKEPVAQPVAAASR